MLFKLIKAERLKLKRSPLWLAFLFMPVIPALLGTLNYMANIEILQSEWFSFWTQHTLFTCYFFLPIMIGIYSSYMMRQEENNRNWNKVLSMPVSKNLVFIAKLVQVFFMIFFSEIWICTLFVISGKVIGLTSAIPWGKLVIWCLFGTLGGTVIAAIQLMISLFIKSFALPVGIALGGGLSGLVFLAKHLGHIWPYSLMAYGMNSNAPQELLESGYVWFVVICIVYIVLFMTISSMILSRRDI
ncbi:MAG: ABC transporter permease [Lachnospiraceae bacterium]|nr:ABC transporter permease [Lachnospiraceae bacterium]